MRYFWTLDEPVEFGSVVSHCQEAGRGWAKTTIHTYLTHLIEKEVLGYHLQGKRKLYYALISEKELKRRFAQDFLEQNFHGSLKEFLAVFNK